MNLTGRAVYMRGQKRTARHRIAKTASQTDLVARAREKGTDQQYLDWLKTQPSAIDGGMDYDPVTGMSYCDPCHFRTAANSGTGTKPEYSAIPMTHAQHLEQHRVGTFAFRPREWWENQVATHLKLWIAS